MKTKRGDIKQIIIYDLSPKIINDLNFIADEKHISRNNLIKEILEDYTQRNEFNKYETEYKSLIKKLAIIIENNTQSLNNLRELAGDLD